MATGSRVLVVTFLVLLSALTGAVVQPAAAGPTDSGDARAANLAAGGLQAQAASADDDLSSGGEFWQGAGLRIDASRVLADSSGDGTFELWRVTSDGRLNQRLRTFTVDEDGTYVLETDSLSGRFVVLYDGDPVYVDGGSAYLASPPDGNPVTVGTSAFRVRRQTLSFGWSDPTVYPGQATTLTVESNRPTSIVAVSAANLSFQDLASVFPESVYADEYDARAGEDVLLVSLEAGTQIGLETPALSPGGSQSFVFDVVDDGARETAELTVLEPAADRHFRTIERHEQVGDVVEAELACDHCFLIVGGPDQGFLDVLEIQDVDGDGNVTFRMNTRYAGMLASASGYPSGVEAYTSPEDSVRRYSPSSTLESVQESLNYDVTSLNDLREQQGLPPSGLDQPIEPGQIRLTVSSSDFVIKRSAYGSGPPLGDGLVVRDETDVETVTLAPRTLDGVASLGAPGDSGFDATASSLAAVAGPRDQVALGDRLVFRIDVSGVFGYLATQDTSVETLLDNREEGLHLSLERLGDGDSETIRVDRIGSRIVADPDTDSIYLVLRTGEASSNWLEEGEYRASFSVEGVDGEYDEYSTRDVYTGYPYLPPGANQGVSGTATLADPTVAVTTPAVGTDPHLAADGELRIRGTTSIAAGAELAVEAAATNEFSWETREVATVRTNGTWTSGLNLSTAPGDEFQVTVYRGQQPLAQETYTVLPPLEEGAGGGNTSESGGGSGGSSDAATAPEASGSIAGIPIPDLGGLGELAVPVGASIGGIAFVWGTWRFVIRRLLL